MSVITRELQITNDSVLEFRRRCLVSEWQNVRADDESRAQVAIGYLNAVSSPEGAVMQAVASDNASVHEVATIIGNDLDSALKPPAGVDTVSICAALLTNHLTDGIATFYREKHGISAYPRAIAMTVFNVLYASVEEGLPETLRLQKLRKHFMDDVLAAASMLEEDPEREFGTVYYFADDEESRKKHGEFLYMLGLEPKLLEADKIPAINREFDLGHLGIDDYVMNVTFLKPSDEIQGTSKAKCTNFRYTLTRKEQ